MRIVFHFRKDILGLAPEQLDIKTENEAEIIDAFWRLVRSARKDYDDFLQYRNSFGEICFLNLNKVKCIEVKK